MYSIIIAESRLFEPSKFLFEEFGVHLYVDMYSNKTYSLIKENSVVVEFEQKIAKPILNDLVSELQNKYNHSIEVAVTKIDKKGVSYIEHEYFSSKHIYLSHIKTMFGEFQPHKPELWRRDDGSPFDFFNRFYKSELLRKEKNDNTEIPPLFNKLLDNLTSSPYEKEALINWIATFYQTLQKSRVAWVIKGEKGTGKGILKNILRNIFGARYLYSEVSASSITANFNAHWKDKLFIVFEEIDFNSLKMDKDKIHAKIKDIVVENTINIEAKGKDMITNYPFHSNIIFFSNKENPIDVEEGDRRLNMLDADTKLEKLDWWVPGLGGTGDQLESMEMAHEVAQYLANYECDYIMYNSLLKNAVWNDAIEANIEKEFIFCNKLLDNDMEWFLEHSKIYKTKQEGTDYSWASYVKHILFNPEYLYNEQIRVNKFKLKELFEVMFGYEPDLKKFNKKLGKAKQYTIDGNAGISCYTFDYVIPQNIEEVETPTVEEVKTKVKESAKPKKGINGLKRIKQKVSLLGDKK